MKAVKEAALSVKEVQKAATLGQEKLLAAAKVNVEKTVRLVKVATLAASSTADETKKKLLNQGAENVKVEVELIRD
jgi:hypothetical protein